MSLRSLVLCHLFVGGGVEPPTEEIKLIYIKRNGVTSMGVSRRDDVFSNANVEYYFLILIFKGLLLIKNHPVKMFSINLIAEMMEC